MQTLKADVAIIGGGAAGCYAALCLQKQGIKPLIICKGLVGKSGASLFAGNLVISGKLLGNTDEQARNTAEFLIKYHNQFLIDQRWARRCGEWIEKSIIRSSRKRDFIFGATMRQCSHQPRQNPQRRRQRSGQFRRSIHGSAAQADHQGRNSATGRNRRNCIVAQRGRLSWRRILPQLMTGEYIVVRARAVVLATGYSDRLYTRSTGTREMSADGIAMAWRAGATLVNMEMQWWHTNDIAHPPSWQRMQVYPNPMLGSEKSARMINSDGEEFFNQQQDDPLAFGPYTVQLKALAKQVHAGKARYDGGYYAGFDQCDAEEVEAYTTYGKSYRQLGLRLPAGPGRNCGHITLSARRHRRGYPDYALLGIRDCMWPADSGVIATA